jgi:hypothetical protein
VSVNFHVGDSPTTFVNLGADDVVTATAEGGQPVTLTESNLLDVFTYAGDLATKDPGTKVTIALTRPSDTNAPASTVTMTEQLALTAPAPGGVFARATNDVVVTWTSDASEDGVTVSWSGDCVDGGSVDVAPPGFTATIAAGTVKKREGDNVADTCDVTFFASRSRTGTLDPAFGGGSITHSFSASSKLTSNP